MRSLSFFSARRAKRARDENEHASRGFAAQRRSCTRALSSLNLKERRECAQSSLKWLKRREKWNEPKKSLIRAKVVRGEHLSV